MMTDTGFLQQDKMYPFMCLVLAPCSS